MKKHLIKILILIGLLTIGRTIVIVFRIWFGIELNEFVVGFATGMLFKELYDNDFT